MGCHVSTSTDGSPDTATVALTAWSRDPGGRTPIPGGLPRRGRGGSPGRARDPGGGDGLVALRRGLAGQGIDHGPQTIGWPLEHEQLPVPSTSTIRRILLA